MVELLLLAAALSADNFAVSIGYGSSNTRISPGMTALLNLFCSAALVASAQFGKRFLQSAGPEWGTRVGAGCFFLMGTHRCMLYSRCMLRLCMIEHFGNMDDTIGLLCRPADQFFYCRISVISFQCLQEYRFSNAA